MMKVKTITGAEVEIGMDQMKKVYDEVARRMHINNAEKTTAHDEQNSGEHHHFMIGGKQTALTEQEMKEISNAWWNKTGKSSMISYFEEMEIKAAENIRKALGHCRVPMCEKDVKAAIAQAIASADPCLIAEVIHEAAEWESAYFGLNSVRED